MRNGDAIRVSLKAQEQKSRMHTPTQGLGAMRGVFLGLNLFRSAEILREGRPILAVCVGILAIRLYFRL